MPGLPFTSTMYNALFPSIQTEENSDDFHNDTIVSLWENTIHLLASQRNEGNFPQTTVHLSFHQSDERVINYAAKERGDLFIYFGADVDTFRNAQNSLCNEKNTKKIEKVSVFYKDSTEVECWINDKTYTSYVVCEPCGTGKKETEFEKRLIASLPIFLPWVFKASPLSGEEKELLSAVEHADTEKYIEVSNQIASTINMDNVYQKAFSKISEDITNSKISDIDRCIENCRCAITQSQRNLEEEFKQLERFKNERAGLLLTNENTFVEELAGMFSTHKNISLVDVKNNGLIYTVEDNVEFYDVDMAEKVINNLNSYLYTELLNSQREKLQICLRRVFLDDRNDVKLRVFGTFRIKSFTEFSVITDSYCNGAMENPHYKHYECLGGNEAEIFSALSKQNYVGAIEQSIAATKSINFSDSAVMRKFGSDFVKSNKKLCVLPDGTAYTPDELYDYIVKSDGLQEETTDGELDLEEIPF